MYIDGRGPSSSSSEPLSLLAAVAALWLLWVWSVRLLPPLPLVFVALLFQPSARERDESE